MIRKGERYKCIQNVYGIQKGGFSCKYSIGRIYVSEKDGCLTDNSDDTSASLNKYQLKDFHSYFRKLPDLVKQHDNDCRSEACITEGTVLKVMQNTSLGGSLYSKGSTFRVIRREVGLGINSSGRFYPLNCLNLSIFKICPPEEENLPERVSHPRHYTWLKDKCGLEAIDIIKHFDYTIGNCLKYILRAGHKSEEGYSDREKALEDLKKAKWYLDYRINELENNKTQE